MATRSIAPHKMPAGYSLYRDEGGYYWWHHDETDREGPMHHDRWWVRRDAIADAQRQTR